MSQELSAGLSFGILALLLLFMGWKRGFFTFSQKPWPIELKLVHVLGAFAIYFAVSFLASAIAMPIFQNLLITDYVGFAIALNCVVSFFIFVSLAIYWRMLPLSLRAPILFRPLDAKPWKENIAQAIYAWIIAFPLVLAVSQMLEAIIFRFYKLTELPDQIAVRFLKSTFDNPLYFFLAAVAIIVLAPLVEETLFRGFLQSFIRKHLGRNQAILITSACFALFHYSVGQGLSNISIIGSLFVLALFLGFLYEKQGSLVAPIALHACFNTISVINLYLFGGFTTGL